MTIIVRDESLFEFFNINDQKGNPMRGEENFFHYDKYLKDEIVLLKRSDLDYGDSVVFEIKDKTFVKRVDVLVKLTYSVEEYDSISHKLKLQNKECLSV